MTSKLHTWPTVGIVRESPSLRIRRIWKTMNWIWVISVLVQTRSHDQNWVLFVINIFRCCIARKIMLSYELLNYWLLLNAMHFHEHTATIPSLDLSKHVHPWVFWLNKRSSRGLKGKYLVKVICAIMYTRASLDPTDPLTIVCPWFLRIHWQNSWLTFVMRIFVFVYMWSTVTLSSYNENVDWYVSIPWCGTRREYIRYN
jgi:hypothetical protein